MSDPKHLLQGLDEKVEFGRECALLGDYSNAVEHFKIVMSQIDLYLKKVNNVVVERQWKRTRGYLKTEFELLQKLEHETKPQNWRKPMKKSIVKEERNNFQIFSKDPQVWSPPKNQVPKNFSGMSRLERRRYEKKLKGSGADINVGGIKKPMFGARGGGGRYKGGFRKKKEKKKILKKKKSFVRKKGGSKEKSPPKKKEKDKEKVNVEKKEGSDKEVEGEGEKEKKFDGGTFNKELVATIERDIINDNHERVEWDDIAGLETAKRLLREAAVIPLWIPNYFRGIREPWRGVLMFGPPGTGKTMLAKAVATVCKTTFFNVSVAGITSKWRGESEKLVRLLFEMARFYAPSTIFIDEIDSLCSSRGSGGEHEASRRVKTELLVQMDGIHSSRKKKKKEKKKEGEKDGEKEDDKKEEEEEDKPEVVLVLGATNHPWDLDEALRRRMEKRIYIPLPSPEGRKALFEIIFHKKDLEVSEDVDVEWLVKETEGYSASDIKNICRDVSLMALAKVTNVLSTKGNLKKEDVMNQLPKLMANKVSVEDFKRAFKSRSPSVNQEQLDRFEKWRKDFGAM